MVISCASGRGGEHVWASIRVEFDVNRIYRGLWLGSWLDNGKPRATDCRREAASSCSCSVEDSREPAVCPAFQHIGPAVRGILVSKPVLLICKLA